MTSRNDNYDVLLCLVSAKSSSDPQPRVYGTFFYCGQSIGSGAVRPKRNDEQTIMIFLRVISSCRCCNNGRRRISVGL